MTTVLATHLWQSTLFVGVAALLTVLLRSNHARTRYAIWLAASVKFVVPFGVLAAIGRQFAWRTEIASQEALAAAAAIAAPFTAQDFSPSAVAASSIASPAAAVDFSTLLLAIWIAGGLLLLGVWCLRWRQLRAVLQAAKPVSHGRELEILRRVERASGSRAMPLLISEGSLEPGIVGCLNPVILWPSDISHRMSDAQVEAILLHELAHVKRRDNLLALVHMCVQAVFWFHPVVWWIGARLVDERERACDEEVVRLGADPHQYAESILRTCEYAVESPLVCVAGVTGANLKRRITAIVGSHRAARLGGAKLALLTTVGLLVAVGPIVAGSLTTIRVTADATDNAPMRRFEPSAGPQAESRSLIVMTRRRMDGPADETRLADARRDRQTSAVASAPDSTLKFEVASIKQLRNTGGDAVAIRSSLGGSIRPGALFSHAGSIRALILRAYGIPFVQQIGGPDWIREDNYTINAKAPEDLPATPDNLSAMIRALLADRFNLVVRQEEREVPIYALTLARSDKRLGPKLQLSTCPPPGSGQPPILPPNQAGLKWEQGPRCGQIQSGRGLMLVGGFPMTRLTDLLQFELGRPVVDRTGLMDSYVLEMSYTPQAVLGAGAGANSDAPSVFTAIQEQLGLKLESQRAPMQVLVIDGIQRPTEN